MSEPQEPPRRDTYVEHAAVYVAAGASAAQDLLRFPPDGSTPFEKQLKLGSGGDRFLLALNTLMTWGAQRASGIEVLDIRQGDEDRYAGIVFDDRGTPEVAPEADVRYGPDGDAFLTAGTTAVLKWPDSEAERKMRVVYVTDTPRLAGFALGTADEAGVIGETAYFIEHREDDSVWAATRGFYWAPTNGLLGLKARTEIRLAVKQAAQQLTSLMPGATTVADFGKVEAEPESASESAGE